MAIIPILEQKDSKIIVKTLLEKNLTIKELNESLIKQKNLNISTATLYRRVKELYLAGLLDKLENGSYTVSNNGKVAYNELYTRSTSRSDLHYSLSEIINHLSGKESYILRKIKTKSYYTNSLVNDLTISPNDPIRFN